MHPVEDPPTVVTGMVSVDADKHLCYFTLFLPGSAYHSMTWKLMLDVGHSGMLIPIYPDLGSCILGHGFLFI